MLRRLFSSNNGPLPIIPTAATDDLKREIVDKLDKVVAAIDSLRKSLDSASIAEKLQKRHEILSEIVGIRNELAFAREERSAASSQTKPSSSQEAMSMEASNIVLSESRVLRRLGDLWVPIVPQRHPEYLFDEPSVVFAQTAVAVGQKLAPALIVLKRCIDPRSLAVAIKLLGGNADTIFLCRCDAAITDLARSSLGENRIALFEDDDALAEAIMSRQQGAFIFRHFVQIEEYENETDLENIMVGVDFSRFFNRYRMLLPTRNMTLSEVSVRSLYESALQNSRAIAVHDRTKSKWSELSPDTPCHIFPCVLVEVQCERIQTTELP